MKYISRHIYHSLLVLFVCIAMPADVLAQLTDTTGTGSGQRGAPHIYKYDARTTAMGDATVSDPTNLAAININPASMSFIREFHGKIEFNAFHNWNNNLMTGNATIPVYAEFGHRVAAQVGLYHAGFNSLNPLGGNPQPQPNLSMYQVDLAYAYAWENMLSVGVFNSTTLSRNSDAQYWTNFTNIGLLYAPTPTLSYGVVFKGLGRSVVYDIIDENTTTLGSQNLRESLELGATVKFPVEEEDTNVALSLANEKRFGQNGIWYKIGLEVIAASQVAFRGGFVLHPENRVAAPRLGLGYITDFIELDYAVSFNEGLYERYHQLGFTIHFD